MRDGLLTLWGLSMGLYWGQALMRWRIRKGWEYPYRYDGVPKAKRPLMLCPKCHIYWVGQDGTCRGACND